MRLFVPTLKKSSLQPDRKYFNLYCTRIERYLVELILATREPQRYLPEPASKLQIGASPRGTIALDACARSRAWLQGRDFARPDDVQKFMQTCCVTAFY